jgi:hypothetical protein
MAAQEDSLLSPITAVADRSESTTLLVSEGSGLPRVLQQAFEDGARPPPLALLAQVLQSITGHEIPVSTNVTEGRMKTAVKTKAKKTNSQASFGGSIRVLKANMEVEAAIELAHDLDETGHGMPCVCLGVGLLGVV